MSYRQWLIITIAAVAAVCILFPIIRHAIQNWDFKRQVEGKRPMRQAGEEGRTPSGPAESPQNQTAEMLKAESRARSMQNLIGPK